MPQLSFQIGDQQYSMLDRDELSGQWAAGSLTLVDFAAIRNNGLAELVDEVSGAFPEMVAIGARPIDGTKFTQSVRTRLPGSRFTKFNKGANSDKGSRAVRTFNCKPIEERWDVHKLLAKSQSDPWEVLMAEEAQVHLIAAFQNVCRQMYYGIGNDEDGFPGLHAIYDPALTVDAEGTTDGQKESVWFLRTAGSSQQFLLANNMDLDVTDVRTGDAYDEDGKPYAAYIQELMGNIGFKVSNLRTVGRVKNCTLEDGKCITGNLAAELIAKFPTNQGPDICFMSSSQREAYRQSLITTENPEPKLPTEIQNVRIIPTDAIVAGHALEVA